MSTPSVPAGGFTPTGTIASHTDRRRVVFATVVGTTVEWYDFFIYATAVGLVFGELFFAPLGAKVAHTIPQTVLRRCFAGFLLLTSLRMFYSLL